MSFPEGGRIVDLVKKKKPGTRYPTNRHVDGLKKLPLRATDVLVLLCPLARRNKKKKNAGLKEKKNTGKTVRGGRFRTVTIRRIKKKTVDYSRGKRNASSRSARPAVPIIPPGYYHRNARRGAVHATRPFGAPAARGRVGPNNIIRARPRRGVGR